MEVAWHCRDCTNLLSHQPPGCKAAVCAPEGRVQTFFRARGRPAQPPDHPSRPQAGRPWLGARRHPPTSLRIRGCSSADDSWRPSLCKSGDGRCFVLRLPGVMTRRPCGAQLHDDEALFSLGARGTLARCGLWRRLGGSRREPPGGPRGPPSVCSIPPPGLRLRAVYAAQVCFWMVCTFVVYACLVLQWCQWDGMLAQGSPPSAAAATLT